MWVDIKEGLPTQGRVVLVMTEESYIPFTGYWKDNGDGPYWVTPGKGGTVLFWSDCIPTPYPKAEEFRKSYERIRNMK